MQHEIFADDVYADVTGIAEKRIGNETGQEEVYLAVRDLGVELNVKNVQMSVKKVFNNNRILSKFKVLTMNITTLITNQFKFFQNSKELKIK